MPLVLWAFRYLIEVDMILFHGCKKSQFCVKGVSEDSICHRTVQ